MQKETKGLSLLFFTELMDRLGYYGIQSILVLFLIHKLAFNDDRAFTYFGIFSTLAFTLTIIGGYAADRALGYLRAIYVGILLIICGNLILFFDTFLLLHLNYLIFMGFSAVILGIGLFKSSNVSLLGTLYPKDEVKKDFSFTMFYMGMNSGAVLGPIVFGLLALHFGYWLGFLVSAIGFTISFLLYCTFRKKLFVHATVSPMPFKQSLYISLGILLSFVIVLALFYYPELFNLALIVFLIGLAIFITRLYIQQEKVYQKHIIYILILYAFATLYFASSMQIGSSLILFIHRCIDTNIFGYQIPAEAFASLDPVFIILLAPVFAFLLSLLEKHFKTVPSLVTRTIIGLLAASLAFLIFAVATFSFKTFNPLWFIILANMVLAFGELIIGPAMMAAPNKLLPQNIQATFVSFYFLSNAFAAYLAGNLAKLTIATPAQKALHHGVVAYRHAYYEIALVVLVAAVVLLSLAKVINKLALKKYTSRLIP